MQYFPVGIRCLQNAMHTEITQWPFWESVCEEKNQDTARFSVKPSVQRREQDVENKGRN